MKKLGKKTLQNCENHNSRVVKTTIQEFPKSQFKNDKITIQEL